MRYYVLLALALFLDLATLHGDDSPSPSAMKESRTLWTFQRDGVEIDTCAQHDGLLIVACAKGELVALNTKDGSRVWDKGVGEAGVSHLAFTNHSEHDLLIVSSIESVVALDRKTGDFRWLRLFPHGFSEPVVVGDFVCGGSYDGKAYGLNLSDGKIVWTSDFLNDAPADPPGFDGKRARFGDHPARPSRTASDGQQFFFTVFDQCRAVSFNVRKGERGPNFPTRGWMLMKPVITEKQVLVGSQDKHFYCFDKQTGKELWKFPTGSRVEASCIVMDDRVYFGSCDANLYCLNRTTGELVWKFATERHPKYGGPIYETPVLDGSNIILPAMQGQIYVVDAVSGKEITTYRPSPISQIDGAEWDGQRLFVQTRKNFDNMGEEVIYAVGK